MRKAADSFVETLFLSLPFVSGVTMGVGLLFCKERIPWDIPCRFVLLSLSAGAILQLAYRRTANFGLSILILISALVFAGTLPGWLGAGALFVLAAVFWIRQAYLRGRSWKFWLVVFVNALVLGFIPLTTLMEGWANFAITHDVAIGAVHADSLFFSAFSNMFRNHGIFSTGMHGLPPLSYHMFVHFFYATLGKLLHLPTVVVFGWATFGFLGPLFLISILAYSEELSPSLRPRDVILSVVLLGFCLLGFLGREHFDHAGQYNSYLLSESYCFGLIILLAAMSFYLRAEKVFFPWLLVFVLVACLSKVSVGYVLVIFLIFNEVWEGLWKKKSFSLRVLVRILCIGVCWAGAYYFVRGYAGSNKVMQVTFSENYFQTYFAMATRGTYWNIGFLLPHFFFPVLGIGVFLSLRLSNPTIAQRYEKLFLAVVLCTAATFPALHLSIMAGAGYYFTNIAMILALPLILSIRHGFSRGVPGRHESPYSGLGRALSIQVTGVAVISFFCFGIPEVVKNLEFFRNRLDREALRISTHCPNYSYRGHSPHTQLIPYVEVLSRISEIGRKDLLVYIPKTETHFWKEYDYEETPPVLVSSWRTPLLIPAISGLPSLFGLPPTFIGHFEYYGYQDRSLWQRSARMKISREELMAESKRLGFAGYIEVDSSGYTVYDHL